MRVGRREQSSTEPLQREYPAKVAVLVDREDLERALAESPPPRLDPPGPQKRGGSGVPCQVFPL